ncbi:hypothetical protein [Bdellovibrio svalbardensis]|uniref:Sulfite exporter TauE/SafE family protein n=1 Tax=Bdellovibrio svalbardensis TaxID=2972972 RepID=A0ABT6DJ70_9BACT|nr:hypothetical protein [Bdellovibrio svalbardensis]MDG0816908.1 hypothetical protein [Bdellovibrio svalbardensis]
MGLLKKIVYSNAIGFFMIVGACVGIVGGSMVICGASVIGLLLSGG